MSNYGIVRPADVAAQDVEIFVHFTPSRDVQGDTVLTKLDANEVLIPVNNPNNPDANKFELMGGFYTLKLPVASFSQKGIYSVIIKPLEIRTRITDCGVLSSLPDRKGLIFDKAIIDNTIVNRFENGGLAGYRIEYLTTDSSATNTKVNNFFTIITSNNKAEPVNQNLSNSSQKAIRYRFNDNSSLVFCTVTPSSAPTVKPSAIPFIGSPNQNVIITNTFFNPITIEIEMVEYDVESIAVGMFGNQSKSIEDGIYTNYNFKNEIYKQYNLFEIKDQFTGAPQYEVKQSRDTIDFTKQFNNIKI